MAKAAIAQGAKGTVFQWTGKPITQPGIYRGISLDCYHAPEICDAPSVSSSALRTIFNRSPAHYWATSVYNPKAVEDEDKASFIFGRATHHLILGEPNFRQHFTARPDELEDEHGILKPWQGNRAVCKKWLEDRKNEGLNVLTPDQIENIKGAVLVLGKHPLVQQGILHGDIEHSYFWRDKETGFWLKWRPDATPNASADFVDLKTTRDVRWPFLQTAIRDYAYHQQGGLGRWACRELLGIDMTSFSLFFIESKNPWATDIVQLKDNELDRGEKMNRAALRLFWKCWKAREWPGPGSNEVRYIELAERDQTRIDERLQALST